MRHTRDSAQFLIPPILLLLFIFLLPPIYNIFLSFRDLDLFQMTAVGGGTFIGLRNYAELIRDPVLYKVFLNTWLWLTAATVVLRVVLGFGLAVLLDADALRRWHLTALTRTLLFLPWAIPPVVAVTIWKWMLNSQYGFVNLLLIDAGLIDSGINFLANPNPYITWWSILLPIIWKETPFVAIVYLSGLQSIPKELYEIAQIDGAGWWAVFRYITIPLMRPITLILTFMLTIWTFNNFVYVWLTTRGGPADLTHVMGTMVYYQSFIEYRLGYGATFGVLMVAFMAVFAVLYLRFIFASARA
jgi:multiple sugar transport system permease protein